MRFGLFAAITWALDTVILSIALSCSAFFDTPTAIALASFTSTFLHDATSAIFMFVYMAVRRKLAATARLMKTKYGWFIVLAAVIGAPLGMTGYVMAIDNIGPAYTAAISSFFPAYGGLVMTSMYLMGILVGILVALVLKNTAFKGDPVPFVMELPNYRLPSAATVARLAWDKGKGFVRKAFTIVFVATIIIWFLQTFDIRFNVVTDQADSLLAGVGQLLAPIFAPLGFGDWRASTALAAGFAAKESVVSTLTVLLGGDVSALATLFTPLTAFCFLVFTLLYTPCVAAVSTVRSELGTRMMWAVVALQCGVAWIVAFAVHAIGMALGLA